VTVLEMPLSEILEEYVERLGGGIEPTVLTLTEDRGFMEQSVRFKKRLAVADTTSYKVIRRNDIAFNPYLLWAGAIAQNQTWDVGLLSPLYPTFRARSVADSRYVWHMLRSPAALSRFDSISFGSVPRKRRASTSDFLKTTIPLPALPEQRRIASILDRAAANARKATTSLELLDELQSSVFETEQRGVGATWTPYLLGDLLEVKGGKRVPKGVTFSQEATEHPYLRVTDMRGGRFRTSDLKYIDAETHLSIARYVVEADDLVISIAGTVGVIARVPDALHGSNLTENAARLRRRAGVTDQTVSLTYLEMLLNTPAVQEHFAVNTGQATVRKLALFKIEQTPVSLPPKAVQEVLRARVLEIDALRSLYEKRQNLHSELFSSLQQCAFAGQL
jgi:type I restriction enzyme, S subunit